MQEAIAPRKVLVLYWTPLAPSTIRAAIRHHLEAISQGPSEHEVTFWNLFDRGGPLLRRGHYDAVILHTTLLCLRWFDSFPTWRRRLSWLGDVDCLKIAIPQDEYNRPDVLDEWLRDLGVDHIFSNFGADLTPLFYPHMSHHAKFQSVFTGYIDSSMAGKLESRMSPSKARPLDVVYRSTHPQYWFGSLGQLKYLVGKRAQAEAEMQGLKTDISSNTDDAILGEDWFDFLGSGRVVVGCESGSSVLDRRGEMQASVRALLREHPSATFEEVSARMPPGWDAYNFGVIGPRHFEGVITKTCQVLVRGRYDDVLVPGRHYIPVRPDLADLGDALQTASDPAVASQFAERAYDEIYRSGRYTYRALAEQIDRVLDTRPPRPLSRNASGSVVARFGAWRLNRPSDLDSGWTLAPLDSREDPIAQATPWKQVWRLVRRREGRQIAAGALRGRLSRRLVGAYLRAGEAATSIPADRLITEARLLDRMSLAQTAQPHTPASRTIKATSEGTTLMLSVLRKPPKVGVLDDDQTWPPRSIVVRLPSFGGLTGDLAGEQRHAGFRLDAVSALAAVRPLPVRAALHPLLDDVGGARSRPRVHSLRSRLGSLVATARMLFARPMNLWLLYTAFGRAPIREAADDLLKLDLLRGLSRSAQLASHMESTGTLCLVTEPGDAGRDSAHLPKGAQVKRIVWDHSAVSDHVLAQVGFGRRVRVYLGAAGVHEFTAVEALPSAARKVILRQLES